MHAIEQRFADYGKQVNDPVHTFKSGAIWIHAVSLGETRAAQVLVKGLLESINSASKVGENPPRFLLTHSTATGRQAGIELIDQLGLTESNALQVWYPWDTPGAVSRFLKQFKPRLGLLMETEVWPNMVLACQQNLIPLILVNARMNDKSFKSAQALGAFAQTVYKRLTAVLAQSPADATRLRALGAPVTASLGNLKFDATINQDQLILGRSFAQRFKVQHQKPIIVFASSRQGEEALFFHALLANRTLIQGVQWLVVPRHPQRFGEVSNIGLQFGFAVSKRANALPEPNAEGEYFEQSTFNPNLLANIWLGDTVGQMPIYYGMADVVLLGGSFEPFGGQNLIEAAACGCPLVMGPHVFNFSQAANQALERGAALQVPSLHGACQVAHQIALNPTQQKKMSQLALEFASDNRGAVSKTIDALEAYI